MRALDYSALFLSPITSTLLWGMGKCKEMAKQTHTHIQEEGMCLLMWMGGGEEEARRVCVCLFACTRHLPRHLLSSMHSLAALPYYYFA